jgi:PTS system fructose-specific IIC component
MKKIVAVTSCPTGIAHTYMAAEALENAGKELGVEVIVETNGSIGVENQLTKADIKEAVAVIIAADARVQMARFDEKPLKEVSVSYAIKNAKELVEEALSGKFPIYESY